MRHTLAWSWMAAAVLMPGFALAQVAGGLDGGLRGNADGGADLDRAASVAQRAIEARQAALEDRAAEIRTMGQADARAQGRLDQRFDAGVGRVDGLIGRGDAQAAAAAGGLGRLDAAIQNRIDAGGPPRLDRPGLGLGRLDGQGAAAGRLDGLPRPGLGMPPGLGLLGRGQAGVDAPGRVLPPGGPLRRDPGLGGPPPGGPAVDAGVSAGVDASVGGSAGTTGEAGGASPVPPAGPTAGAGGSGGAAGDASLSLQADRILAHRLSQIDKLRERAVATGSETLLQQADHLETIARRNHEQMSTRMSARADAGLGIAVPGRGVPGRGEGRPPFGPPGPVMPPTGPAPPQPTPTDPAAPTAPGSTPAPPESPASSGSADSSTRSRASGTVPAPRPWFAP